MVHQVADSQDFDAQLKQAGGKLVVVDFFATWQVPMILIQFFFYFRRTESSKAVARTSDGLFMSFSGRMVDYGGPFIFHRLMFFSLPRCGPCKMIAPHLEEMSKTMDDVVFLKVAKLLLCLT